MGIPCVWLSAPRPALAKANHHDYDEDPPGEREQWIAPHDFWKMVPTEQLRRGMMPELIENVAFEYAQRNPGFRKRALVTLVGRRG
jgi:hypothetical protein